MKDTTMVQKKVHFSLDNAAFAEKERSTVPIRDLSTAQRIVSHQPSFSRGQCSSAYVCMCSLCALVRRLFMLDFIISENLSEKKYLYETRCQAVEANHSRRSGCSCAANMGCQSPCQVVQKSIWGRNFDRPWHAKRLLRMDAQGPSLQVC